MRKLKLILEEQLAKDEKRSEGQEKRELDDQRVLKDLKWQRENS